MKISVLKLHPNAVAPTQGAPFDAGYDLTSVEHKEIPPMGRTVVPTGISMEIPEGFYGRVAPRSGLAVKKGIDVLAGVIDSGYRNEIGVVLINLGGSLVTLPAGTRIAQIIIEKCHEVEWNDVEELAASNRGQGGFGSTGT